MDIYGAHKALQFGLFQRSEYTLDDFIQDIEIAEESIFGEIICSDFVHENEAVFDRKGVAILRASTTWRKATGKDVQLKYFVSVTQLKGQRTFIQTVNAFTFVYK